MVFFDDELRNKEVEKKLGEISTENQSNSLTDVANTGVTFVYVTRGVDVQTFKKGILAWREQKSS